MHVKLYRILCLWGGGNDTHNEKLKKNKAVDCPCTDKELIDILWEKNFLDFPNVPINI